MNYKISKISKETKKDVIDFIGNESLKLYLEYNPSFKNLEKNGVPLDYKAFDLISENIKDDASIYYASIDDEIIGAGYINDSGYIEGLYVKEEYRNSGIGTNLLRKLIKSCDDAKIITVDARITAINLYKRFNFKITDNSYHVFIPMERRESYEKSLSN